MLKRSLLVPNYPFWITLAQALLLHLVMSLLASPVSIYALVPCILRATICYSAVGMAYVAVGCGLLVDLFTCTTPLGYFGLAYWLIAALLRPLRHRLDQEQWSSLWTLLVIWSLCLSIAQWLGALVGGVPIEATWKILALQLLAGPLANCALLSLWFGAPAALRLSKWSRS
jgi:hypothetical protein